MFDTTHDPTPGATPTPSATPRPADPADLAELSDEDLEAELCVQAGNLAAGECQLLVLIGELDRRELWARQGARCCAQWLSWRIGTATGAAREQLRVARALGRLPATRAAFSSGELSYSKVRAITRVATADDEQSLLELARHASASQLERIVRAYRRATADEQARANALHERRYLRHHLDEDGMVVLSARLDPEEGAIVLGAIEAARQAMAGRAEAGRAEAERAEAGRAGREAAEGDPTSPQGPTDVSAETSLLGDAAPAWEDFEPGEGVPAWDAGEHEHEHEPLAAGASPPFSGRDVDEPETIDPAQQAGADALVLVCAAVLAQGFGEGVPEPSVSVLVHVDEAVLLDPASAGCAQIERLGAISAHSAARLACDGAISRLEFRADGSVEQLGATRTVPDRMRRALHARDRGCRFPGCDAKRFLHAHHVVFVSHGGPTALSNLVTLCSAHHRLVHEGGFSLSLASNGQVRVRDQQGKLLPLVPDPPEGSPGALLGHNAARGIRIERDALAGDGDRLDLALTIDALLSQQLRTRA